MVYRILLTLFFITGCWDNKKHSESIDFEAGRAARSGRDIKVPKALAQNIESDFIKTYRAEHIEFQGRDLEVLKKIQREYLDIHVKLTQKNNSAMDNNYKFFMPRGGGVIDFAEFITGTKGSFNIQVEVRKNSDPEKNIDHFYSYFVSDSRLRKIGDKEFGHGCNKFMSLNHFVKQLKGEGLRLNATQQRHVSVVAGTFYFYMFEGSKLFLGTLTFEDSRFPELQCSTPLLPQPVENE